MALQGPFFGKRDSNVKTDPTRGEPRTSPGTSALGSAGSSTQPFSTPQRTPGATALTPAAAAPAADGNAATLTVGRNIKLKGVEITDCDTLVVEGEVEATMKSRVVQIADSGSFKGSVQVKIAEVHGEFDGDLTATDKLVVFATGKVSGTIKYGKIVVEEGGRISGQIEASGSAPAPAPAPASSKSSDTVAAAS